MKSLTVIENSLIPVYRTDKGERVVNMRELHAWLKVETKFADWIVRKIADYGFIENQDYIVFLNSEKNPEGGRPSKEYIFKLEPAKEIAMVENNEKGKEIRRYFIRIEEKYKQQVQPFKLPSNFAEACRMLADEWEQNQKLLAENAEMKPKADYFDDMAERNHLTNFRDTAKELKIKESDFIEWLIKKGYIYRDSKGNIKPYAQFVPNLFEIKEFVAKNGYANSQTMITHKGREKFRVLLREGIPCLSR